MHGLDVPGRMAPVLWRKKCLFYAQICSKKNKKLIIYCKGYRSSRRIFQDGHRKNSNCLSEGKKCSSNSVPGRTGSGWMWIVKNPTGNNTHQKQWLCPSSTLSDTFQRFKTSYDICTNAFDRCLLLISSHWPWSCDLRWRNGRLGSIARAITLTRTKGRTISYAALASIHSWQMVAVVGFDGNPVCSCFIHHTTKQARLSDLHIKRKQLSRAFVLSWKHRSDSFMWVFTSPGTGDNQVILTVYSFKNSRKNWLIESIIRPPVYINLILVLYCI